MATEDLTKTDIAFDAPDLWAQLDALRAAPARYDQLAFGLVAMDLSGTVVAYNAAEARFAGLDPERALGLVFFSDVAPCTNNFLVSGRFEESGGLDATIDYVFTVKMRPVRVKLRLLKSADGDRQYLAVKW